MAEYRVDVWDRDLMRSRPWPWLRDLVRGLLSADTRLARLLAPEQDQPALPDLPKGYRD